MRSELKYVVPDSLLPELRRRIEPFVGPDLHAEAGAIPLYTVNSLYLDTPELSAYEEKKTGVKDRRKLRIRAYGSAHPDATAFLEIKRKYESRNVKSRAPVRVGDVAELLAGGSVERYVRSRPEDARSFLYYVYRHRMQPSVFIRYEREAYVGRFDSTLRITFDRDLCGRAAPGPEELFPESGLARLLPGRSILEVKFDGKFPFWMRGIVAELKLRQQSFSKYVYAIDADPAARLMRFWPAAARAGSRPGTLVPAWSAWSDPFADAA